MVVEEIDTIGERVRNWGRWGAEDEVGTLNHITAQHVRTAAALIRRGRVFELSIPLAADGPQDGVHRANPMHLMTELGDDQQIPGGMRYADDRIHMDLQAGTQWDALAHVHYRGQMYNGFSADTLTVQGAARNSIDKVPAGVTGRGVLLDMARLAGVDWLPAGHVIEPEDLDAALGHQRVTVGQGDVVLVRTGWRRRFHEQPDGWIAEAPGLGRRCAEWLHGRDVAALAADNWAVDAHPGEDPGVLLPLHILLIRDMGMTLGEMFDLEELAEDCAEDGRFEFFFTAPPLKITGAVGSPISPIAIK